MSHFVYMYMRVCTSECACVRAYKMYIEKNKDLCRKFIKICERKENTILITPITNYINNSHKTLLIINS